MIGLFCYGGHCIAGVFDDGDIGGDVSDDNDDNGSGDDGIGSHW